MGGDRLEGGVSGETWRSTWRLVHGCIMGVCLLEGGVREETSCCGDWCMHGERLAWHLRQSASYQPEQPCSDTLMMLLASPHMFASLPPSSQLAEVADREDVFIVLVYQFDELAPGETLQSHVQRLQDQTGSCPGPTIQVRETMCSGCRTRPDHARGPRYR